MEVVSHCAFPVAGRVWKPRPGAFVFTFVCKATFTLAPGKLALAPEQQPVHEIDRPWSEAVTSLYAAADLVPRKLRPDVVLIGNAYAPGGVPARSVVARLSVAEIDKSIEVWCDRTLGADGAVVDGPFFTSLPLLYERAAGGPGTDNPVGIAPQPDAYGAVALPNLTLPGARVAAGVPLKPVGFGPIAARWPTRLARLGRYADELSPGGWHEKPLPPDLDMAYFNVAPLDQQPPSVRNDERIVLENLHPEHPQLAMTLPGIRLRAKVTGPGGDKLVVMTCDTLWIDTSRGICCLSYRGQVLLSSPAEAGWVVISPDVDHEAPAPAVGQEASLTGTLNVEEEGTPPPPSVRTLQPTAMIQSRPSAPALPFTSPEGVPVFNREVRPSGGLPFQQPDSGVPFRRDLPTPPPSPPASGGTPPGGLPLNWGAPQQIPPAPPLPQAMPQPVPPPAVQPLPPAPVLPVLPPAPVPPAPVYAPAPGAAPPSDSPWAIASNVGAGTIAPVPAAAVAAEAPRPLVIPSVAARPSPPKEPVDALDLVFFDPESLPRIRRVPAWKKLIAELDDRPLDPEEEDPAASPDPIAAEDRREILEVLLRAAASDAAAVDEALAAGAREDGRFYPPLVVVNGDLVTPFDEIETLKATVTTVTPLAGNDDNLRASLEIAKEFLKLPGLSSSPQVADGLTGRVRDAFNGAKRQVAPGYLDAQTERALVDQRFYQHRLVLGGRRQRAVFHFAGAARPSSAGATPDASAAKAPAQPAPPAPLVAYLPDSAEAKLPLFARFKVRIIARVHLTLDPYEQGAALEALALARLYPSPRREPNQK